ncbi:MAG: endonuclease [Aquaticitalea sp.]
MIPESTVHTIAFYNTENLFDVFSDDKKHDNDFSPISTKNWTKKRYETKIHKLGTVISKIGFETTNKPPVLIGLAEVENDAVLTDLVESDKLKNHNYGFIHYDSLDERGIDVALLYNKDEFSVEFSKAFPINIEEASGKRDYTRDILLVTGHLCGIRVHVLVNHWPSRHEGRDETDFKRVIASRQLTEIISFLKEEDGNSQIIVLGDFNDNPNSQSILNLKNESSLFNTMESVWSYSRGSVNHRFAWILFDQILLTTNFLEEGSGPFKFLKADIFDEKFLTQYDGKYRGHPYRTYIGQKYKGGYSDHFPVYIHIKIASKENVEK